MMKIPYLIVLFVCFALSPAHADDNANAEENIREVLGVLLPDEPVDRIRTTPFNDLYEVMMGPNVIYISGDGRFVLKGDLLDMQERINVTEQERTAARKHIFASLKPEEFIEFSPENPEHVVYVFTDIDCAYCRRLHQDIPVLNQQGLSVRYLAFPRAGMGSNTANTMEAVWCSRDRRQALTDAKNGKRVNPNQCDSPVGKEYLLGQKIGVRGTPAIYTEDGEELTGYLPPAELISIVRK